MNHQLWTAVGARVLAATFVLAGVVACGDDVADRTASVSNGDAGSVSAPANGSGATRSDDPLAGAGSQVSPSARVIGVEPAPPTPTENPDASGKADPKADPKATREVDGKLNQQEESRDRPVEGDNHSYSTVAPVTPQKSEGVDPQQLPGRKSQ